jgi:hypothetical protein
MCAASRNEIGCSPLHLRANAANSRHFPRWLPTAANEFGQPIRSLTNLNK